MNHYPELKHLNTKRLTDYCISYINARIDRRYSANMNLRNIIKRAAVLTVILILIMVVFFVITIGFFSITASENKESLYICEITLSTSETIENATLLIPVPSYYNQISGRNETILNLREAGIKNIDTTNITLAIEYVNKVPMLRISAEKITPTYRNHIKPIMIMPGQNESELPPTPTYTYSNSYSEDTPVPVKMEIYFSRRNTDNEINTGDPAGSEPLFMPYRIVEEFRTENNTEYGEYYIPGGSSGYITETPFILSYEAEDSNNLSISTEIQGINQWWVLGWQSDSYKERIRNTFTGGANGTYLVTGILITG